MSTNANRITKSDRFADILAMLNGETVTRTSVEDATAFIKHEMELLAKKNASVDKKKAEESAKNATFKSAIVDFLSVTDVGEGMTCTNIGKSIDSLSGFNTSKMSALCNALVKEGVLVKASVKGQTLFKLA